MSPHKKNTLESFGRLIQVIRSDEEINQKVTEVLRLDPYRRRYVLNKWLEQLRRKKSSEKLMQALSCLFDDGIAQKVLTLLNKHKIKNSKDDLFLTDTKF